MSKDSKDWFLMKDFNLSVKEEEYKEKLKTLTDTRLIILLLSDLIESVPRYKRRKCIRLVEAHRRNHE